MNAITKAPDSQAPIKKKRSIVRRAQLILGAAGALVSLIGTMPLPANWFAPHSAASNFFFEIGMLLAIPSLKLSELLGLGARHGTTSGPENSPWGLCIAITLYNTILCILAGTILGLLIKVLNAKSQKR